MLSYPGLQCAARTHQPWEAICSAECATQTTASGRRPGLKGWGCAFPPQPQMGAAALPWPQDPSWVSSASRLYVRLPRRQQLSREWLLWRHGKSSLAREDVEMRELRDSLKGGLRRSPLRQCQGLTERVGKYCGTWGPLHGNGFAHSHWPMVVFHGSWGGLRGVISTAPLLGACLHDAPWVLAE